ncbi:hypothetical protein [Amphibacillus indicireducens]|uniref:Uncharacterized protein n=1 Tax=Amphibacillus indicireducens TaxID=1076330 RepID=A0ABP7VS41_9BACI
MLKQRSKLLFISMVWTLVYGLLLRPSPEEIEGMQAIIVVLIVWPGFLIFQIPLYGIFKKYQNRKIYNLLFFLKLALFLIQPVIIDFQLYNILFLTSILGILLIDFHVMTLENKVNLKEVDVSDQEKQKIFDQYKTSWFLMGSVVLLFSLYFQLGEGNYTIIVYHSLFYVFFVLRKQEPKIKYISIQLLGLLVVYLLAILSAPELLKGILLIAVLILIYLVTKLVYEHSSR